MPTTQTFFAKDTRLLDLVDFDLTRICTHNL